MDIAEVMQGLRLAVRNKDAALPLTWGEFAEVLESAQKYRMGSENPAPAAPQRAEVPREFPKPLAKYINEVAVAKYLAPSLSGQHPETHGSPWWPLRSMAEYDSLNVPVWNPDSLLTEYQRRVKAEAK